MRKAVHFNLRIDPNQYISQIRGVPTYDYIHLVQQSKDMVNSSFLNEMVYYFNEIFSTKIYVEKDVPVNSTYYDSFLEQVNAIDPETYAEWTKIPIPLGLDLKL